MTAKDQVKLNTGQGGITFESYFLFFDLETSAPHVIWSHEHSCETLIMMTNFTAKSSKILSLRKG